MDEMESVRVGVGFGLCAMWWGYRCLRRMLMRRFWPERFAQDEAERALERRLLKEFGRRLGDRDEVVRVA